MRRLVSLALAFWVVASVPAAADGGDACTLPADAATPPSCLEALQVDAARTEAGGWELAAEPSQRVAGGTNAWLISRSRQLVAGPQGGAEPAALTIRCLDGTMAVYFTFADQPMADGPGHGDVTYRLDQLAPKTIPMAKSFAGDALGRWSATTSMPFIRTLFGQQNVTVEATTATGVALAVDFPIGELATAIGPLRRACHW